MLVLAVTVTEPDVPLGVKVVDVKLGALNGPSTKVISVNVHTV